MWTQHLHLPPGVILTGILVLAAGLRAANLGGPSFSYDEIAVVGIARQPWHDLLPALRAGEFHPPLYFVLMKLWAGLAGTGEAAFRIPSVGCGIATVGVTYALGRRVVSAPVGLLSAFLVSASPFHIMVSQEARMYAPLGLLVLASTLTLLAGVERGGVGRWAGYAVTAALMLYTQYVGVFVLLAQGIWVAASERRRLGPWMIAVAAIALAYAPWAPALAAQVAHLRGLLGDPGRPVSGRDLGDLLGLLAFGGSLFGMAGYLFPGTLDPVWQTVVLSPFLVVLWRGAAALSSDRRRLLFLGLPPALAIGVTFASALATRVFYPRWLSFLLPFYAIVLARGLFDVAGWARGGRGTALALLTAGLLVYSAPVLVWYYSDPGFDHFRWRTAASLVEHQAKPGDFFLYVNNATRIAFTYYFDEPHPSLTLTSADLLAAEGVAPFTDARARALAAHYPRVWLIVSLPFTRGMQDRLFPALMGAFRVAGARQFTGTGVYLLTAKPP